MDWNTRIARRGDVLAADMDGETVMMDMASGKYFNLGRTGGAVWALMESPISGAAIVARLLEEYEVSRAQCEAEVRAFLATLIEKGLATEARPQ